MLFPWGVIVWLLPTILGAIIGFGIGVGTVPSNDSNNGTIIPDNNYTTTVPANILEPNSTDLFEELTLSMKLKVILTYVNITLMKLIPEDTEINEIFWVYFGIGALSICIISVCTVFLVKHINTRRKRRNNEFI